MPETVVVQQNEGSASLVVAIASAVIALTALAHGMYRSWREARRHIATRAVIDRSQLPDHSFMDYLEIWAISERPRPLGVQRVFFVDTNDQPSFIESLPEISDSLPRVLHDGEALVLRYRVLDVAHHDHVSRTVSGRKLKGAQIIDSFGTSWLAQFDQSAQEKLDLLFQQGAASSPQSPSP